MPPNALSALGLDADEAPGFVGEPAAAFCLPWHSGTPDERVAKRVETARYEAAQHGYEPDEPEGCKLFGPVNRAKGELELHRLIDLTDSVVAWGYHRHPGRGGDIGGTVLLDDDGTWSVQVGRGEHRAAVLAALGRSHLPIRLSRPPLRLADIKYWPQVAAGRITPVGAAAVFRRVLRGQPPPAFASALPTYR